MLFHLTAPHNVVTIMKEGLKANEDGEIFILTDMIVADTIAKNQIGLDRYAVFTIDEIGIEGELEFDDVAEFSRHYQRIVRQPVIKPCFLDKLPRLFEIVTHWPTPWDYLVGKNTGQTREQVELTHQVIRQLNANEITNEQANVQLARIISDNKKPANMTGPKLPGNKQ